MYVSDCLSCRYYLVVYQILFKLNECQTSFILAHIKTCVYYSKDDDILVRTTVIPDYVKLTSFRHSDGEECSEVINNSLASSSATEKVDEDSDSDDNETSANRSKISNINKPYRYWCQLV